jgi:predicted alpha/beta-fold hydrolase
MIKFNPMKVAVRSVNALAAVAPSLAGRIAFDMFCKPTRKELKKPEFHFMATGTLTHEWVDGRRYGIWHWGFKGPIALLVHGWESHSGRWRKMVPILLNAGYQVVAVDAPAHGRSDGNRFTMVEYAGIIRYLLQKEAPVEVIIGHSVGATSLVWALEGIGASFRPEKVILLAPFTSLSYTMEKTMKALGISKRVMEETIRRIEQFTGLKYEEIDITLRAASLSQLNTLIIHDRDDKVTAYTESVKLHQSWPGSMLKITEGFGHGLTAPQVYQWMEEFVLDKQMESV